MILLIFNYIILHYMEKL